MPGHPSASARWRSQPRPIADVLSDYLDELADGAYERGYSDGYRDAAGSVVRAMYTTPGTCPEEETA
jgi:hypothetical protein